MWMKCNETRWEFYRQQSKMVASVHLTDLGWFVRVWDDSPIPRMVLGEHRRDLLSAQALALSTLKAIR